MRNLFNFGFLMIAAAAAACNASSLPSSTGSVRISIMGGRPIADGVYLNGNGPYRMLIDTGAQTNQVDASLARKLGLRRSFRVEMATVGGTKQVGGDRPVSVSLGSANALNQEFLLTTLDGVHGLSDSIQGVLGQEFLSHFDYLLDFAHRRLIFGESVPTGGVRVSIEIIDGRPALQTSVGKLVFDSGTDTMILLHAGRGAGDDQVRTASGYAAVSTLGSLNLLIAGHEYHVARTASITGSTLTEDGELPASVFHAVFISNSGKYAILDPVAGPSKL